jgi:hypothetical protein
MTTLAFDGKEGVVGSSPTEGLEENPATAGFLVSRDMEGDQVMAPSYETPFDDLEPFTVPRPEEIGRRLGVTARSVLAVASIDLWLR